MQHTQVEIEQLEIWEQAWQRGQQLVNEANGLLAEATQAWAESRLQAAADAYRRAHRTLQQAALALAPLTEIEQPSYRALNTLRAEAVQLRRLALATLEELDRRKPVEQCERQIEEGRAALQHAQVALEEGRFADARTMATQASAHNPGLREAVEKLIRDAEQGAREQTRFMRFVIFAVLGVALLVLGAILLPYLVG